MKIGENIVVGKRITVGAIINSTAATFAYFFPEQAPAIVSAAIPVTAAVQIYLVNKYGITQKDK